jgi:hypothetical protein
MAGMHIILNKASVKPRPTGLGRETLTYNTGYDICLNLYIKKALLYHMLHTRALALLWPGSSHHFPFPVRRSKVRRFAQPEVAVGKPHAASKFTVVY